MILGGKILNKYTPQSSQPASLPAEVQQLTCRYFQKELCSSFLKFTVVL